MGCVAVPGAEADRRGMRQVLGIVTSVRALAQGLSRAPAAAQ